jgi:hypothetical protein
MTLTWYRHFERNGGLNQILKRQTSRFHYGSKVPHVLRFPCSITRLRFVISAWVFQPFMGQLQCLIISIHVVKTDNYKPSRTSVSLECTEWAIEMDNPENLATYGTQRRRKTKIQHDMRWAPLHANKHKQRKQDMTPPTNNRKQRRTEQTQTK